MDESATEERVYELAHEGRAALAVDVLMGYCQRLEGRITDLEKGLRAAHDELSRRFSVIPDINI